MFKLSANYKMSVAWTKNAENQYLVESKEHLLQIMRKGTLYSNSGTFPNGNDYWSSSYLQVTNIDLGNDLANILPIGTDSNDMFTGVYDGGLYQIENWSYVGTEFVGLFGYASGATLRKIRLSGVWTLSGNKYLGFVGGMCTSYCKIYDVEGDFSEGTKLTVIAGSSSTVSVGPLFGLAGTCDVYGATVRGTVGYTNSSSDQVNVGGVCGSHSYGTCNNLRNLATFPDGLSGYSAGGIFASTNTSVVSKCLNAMMGSLNAERYCGGIAGQTLYSVTMSSTVNSMRGNITVSGSSYYAGGMVGEAKESGTDVLNGTRLLNYMQGDIVASRYSGGIVGYMTNRTRLAKSVVAMRGSVLYAVRGRETGSNIFMEVSVIESFGMVYTTMDYGISTLVVDDALLYEPSFTDLPYVDLSSTDPDGNFYNWDFVYGNIGGLHPEYTHMILHKAEVSFPFYTEFDLPADNATVFLTSVHVVEKTVYIDPSLTIVTNLVDLSVIRESLNLSSIVLPTKEDLLSSLANVYDITEETAEVASMVNDLFSTGDKVVVLVDTDGVKSSMTTTFVRRGDQINVADVEALLLPFDASIAEVQIVTLELSDGSLVEATLDQASGEVVIGGVVYTAGDYFVMDGKKVVVQDA